MTRLLRCTCTHAYQDARYGRTVRVHNLTKKGLKERPDYRCTVCGSMKPAPVATVRS